VKFIYCFSQELKTKLLKNGFKLLSENSNFSIFENNTKLYFNFDEIKKSEFTLSNTMTF